MSAYVISEVEVRDAEAYDKYRAIASAAVAQYGGRYLARGGATHLAEGGPPLKRIVMLEFPSMAHIHAWYDSPEYAEALKFARVGLDRRLVFVEGMSA